MLRSFSCFGFRLAYFVTECTNGIAFCFKQTTLSLSIHSPVTPVRTVTGKSNFTEQTNWQESVVSYAQNRRWLSEQFYSDSKRPLLNRSWRRIKICSGTTDRLELCHLNTHKHSTAIHHSKETALLKVHHDITVGTSISEGGLVFWYIPDYEETGTRILVIMVVSDTTLSQMPWWHPWQHSPVWSPKYTDGTSAESTDV